MSEQTAASKVLCAGCEEIWIDPLDRYCKVCAEINHMMKLRRIFQLDQNRRFFGGVSGERMEAEASAAPSGTAAGMERRSALMAKLPRAGVGAPLADVSGAIDPVYCLDSRVPDISWKDMVITLAEVAARPLMNCALCFLAFAGCVVALRWAYLVGSAK